MVASVKKIGFLINPIAGMGGAVGLKGTDGKDTVKEARNRGAKEIAVKKALRALKGFKTQATFYYAGSNMGGDVISQLGFTGEEVYAPGGVTSSMDTKN